jgi:hypothetical protein
MRISFLFPQPIPPQIGMILSFSRLRVCNEESVIASAGAAMDRALKHAPFVMETGKLQRTVTPLYQCVSWDLLETVAT